MFFGNRNFDLCYTGLEGELKSLFSQYDVIRNSKNIFLRGKGIICFLKRDKFDFFFYYRGG